MTIQDTAKDILLVDALSMRFSGLKALNDVNLSVKEGSITALIGPNGAGKTTLFNCLTGFYIAQSGNIIFCHDNTKTNLRHLLGEPLTLSDAIHPFSLFSKCFYKAFGGSHLVARMGIARTFQNIRLFREMTVIENLLVAQFCRANQSLISGFFNSKNFKHDENEAVERAYYWLDKFNLSKEANRLAGMLPYGKQRHLEIARSMCTKPLLLCLDEPAAGLNPQETHELRDIILALREQEKVSILLIEHDVSLVMTISDHVVVLDHGVVIAAGTPQQVRENSQVIEAYLGVQHEL